MLVCLATVAIAAPTFEERAVTNPKTPNQIADKLAEDAAADMLFRKWVPCKNFQNGNVTVGLDADESGNDGSASSSKSSEEIRITAAEICNLGSFTRSKSAVFNADKTVITGTMKMEDVKVDGAYQIVFPGVGQAPANTVKGTLVEKLTIFCDYSIKVLNLVPQNIQTYNCRKGKEALASATNMAGNGMEAIHVAGIRQSLSRQAVQIANTNVKVAFNTAVQDWKNAAV